MPSICVDGAAVSIAAIPPCVLMEASSDMPGGKQELVVATGKPALIEDDIDEWIKNYKSDYISPPFVIPGKVVGDKVTQIIGLSTKVAEEGNKLVLDSTTILFTVKVDSPAKMPTPSGPQNDPVPNYMATVSFTDAAQAKFDAL